MQRQENENRTLRTKKGKNENWALKVEVIVLLGFAQYKQRVY